MEFRILRILEIISLFFFFLVIFRPSESQRASQWRKIDRSRFQTAKSASLEKRNSWFRKSQMIGRNYQEKWSFLARLLIRKRFDNRPAEQASQEKGEKLRKKDCLILVSSRIVRISKIIRKNSKIKWRICKNRIEKFEIKFFFFEKATKSKRTEYQAMLNAFSRETIYIHSKGTINQDACYQKPPSWFRWNRRERCASAAFGVRLIKFADSEVEEWRATRRCIYSE